MDKRAQNRKGMKAGISLVLGGDKSRAKHVSFLLSTEAPRN